MARPANVDGILEELRRTELNRQAAIRLAAEVSRGGFGLVAFKGLHLAYAVAQHPIQRRSADGDLWVARGRYGDLVALVRKRGDFAVSEGRFATILTDAAGARIDVQRHLWPPPFRQGDAALIAAECRPSARLGTLLVPSLATAAVIALAHYVKDALGAFGSRLVGPDLRALEQAGLDVAMLVSRLRAHRLRRVALVALTDLSDREAAFGAWLAALRPSEAEQRRARWLIRRLKSLTLGAPGYLTVPALAREGEDLIIGVAVASAREARRQLLMMRRAP